MTLREALDEVGEAPIQGLYGFSKIFEWMQIATTSIEALAQAIAELNRRLNALEERDN